MSALNRSPLAQEVIDGEKEPIRGTQRGTRVAYFPRPSHAAPRPASAKRHLGGYLFVKRVVDVVVSFILIVVLFPLMVLTAVAVRMSSSGPVIFRQPRLTVGGRKFTLLKFRTMRADAEQHTGPVWASKNDPRVTSIGNFLRKTRLDELPQLVNVLSGDMSLIGPRPERPEIAVVLEKEMRRFNDRLQLKAGITGLAQVASGYAASVESYRKKLAHDIFYVKNCSLMLDLRIALRTIRVILTGSGAR